MYAAENVREADLCETRQKVQQFLRELKQEVPNLDEIGRSTYKIPPAPT
jgi:hypothetical protein